MADLYILTDGGRQRLGTSDREIMNDELLIECVSQYEVLYDLSHAKYMDISYKNHVWNKIAEEMKTDVLACKARWNNIRDTYRKSLKKFIPASGRRAKRIKLYKYADQLSFLKKYFDEREPKTEIESQENIMKEENVPLNRTQDQEELVIKEDLQSQRSPSTVQRKENSPFQVPTKSPRQKLSAESLVPAAAKLMGYLINKNESHASALAQHPVDAFLAGIAPHPVDAFLAGVAPTLKALSPYNFHLAKSEIFAAVQKYELKTIVENSLHGQSNFQPANLSPPSSAVSTALPSPDEEYN